MKPGLSGIQLEVWDDEIIVSLPGTNYAVTYYKPANSPQLLAKNFLCEDDGRAEPTQAEFLTKAWHPSRMIKLVNCAGLRKRKARSVVSEGL